MQFAPVPAGTAAPAALALRGADPDVEYPVGSPYDNMRSVSHNATNAVATQNHKAVSHIQPSPATSSRTCSSTTRRSWARR